MEAETGVKYAAFIPLGGVPLYRHIISQYRNNDRVRIIFLLDEDAPEFDIDPRESIGIDVIRLKDSGSIGETVLAGLKGVTSALAEWRVEQRRLGHT